MTDDLKPFRGVAFNEPPPHLIADALHIISEQMATLPADADAALVGIATDAGVNFAFVVKTPGGIEIATWIGKTWGSQIEYGAGIKKVFRW
jgi:hypothetical protein